MVLLFTKRFKKIQIMPKPIIFKFDSEAKFWEAALDDVLFSIKETLADHKKCRIGLAGGSTPQHLYKMLADEDLPWGKIILIQIDERYVPSDHPQSNLKMIRGTLTTKIPLPPENLITFDTSLPMESAAKDMTSKMIGLSHKRYPLFDLLILGAGVDGHIASIFEGQLGTCTNYASTSKAKGYEIEDRLTLCPIALKKSNRAILLLKGEEKLPVLHALEGEADEPKLSALREISEQIDIKVLYEGF